MNDYYRIEQTPHGGVIALSLPESVDPVDLDRLNDAILGEVRERAGDTWIVDLASVAYMGSAMLGLMVNLRQQIKSAGGKLILCSMQPRLLEIFRTCCMERLFTIVRSRAEAMKPVA